MHALKLNQNKIYIFILIAIAIGFTILLPALKLSLEGSSILGSETYLHLNQLSHPTNFYDQAISLFVNLFGEKPVVLYFPVILIVSSLLIFSNIFKHFLESDTEYLYALIILILTPAFLAAHLGLTVASIILFALSLTIYLYLRSSYFYLVALAFLYLFDPLIGVLLTMIILVREIIKQNYSSILVLILTLTILIITSFSTSVHFNFLTLDMFSLNFNSAFAFFGGRFGITLFLLVLGLIGIIKLSKQYPFLVISSIIVLILSIIYEPAKLLGIIVLTIYSAKAFNALIERKWEVQYIGQLVIILFLCMLLFSTTIFVKSELFQDPTHEDLDSLEFLKNLPLTPQANLLVMPSEAEYTKYYSGRSVFASSYDSKKNLYLVDELILSRDYSFIKEEFQEEKIGLVLVDEHIVSRLKKPEEGILFVMNNNDNFVKLYQTKETIIYYFKLWDE